MTKFLAIVKREYLQRVRARMFIAITVLGPVMLVVFTIVPGLLFSLKTGGDTRVAIVDLTEGGRLYGPVRDSLLQRQVDDDDRGTNRLTSQINSNAEERIEKAGKSLAGSFSVEQVFATPESIDEVRQDLNARIARDELDGYLIIPFDVLTNSESRPAFYGRNVGDVITRGQIRSRFDSAIRKQRFIANGITEQEIEKLSKPVRFETYPVSEKGEAGAQDSGMSRFMMVFIVAFLLYITVLLYGQVVLGAIIEEKETRIAEILFSSVGSFTLMFGKLIGVSLVALTQLAIWGLGFLAFSVGGIALLATRGVEGVNLPRLPPIFFAYFFLFFLLGYFIYAALYVLIGSMATTAQEGGQLAIPVVFTLGAGLYMAFTVVRSPNSSFAFWVSMFPLFAPITMIVRIVAQTPPAWQIALSFAIGILTVVLLLWVAARIYRIGMLIHGKRATIPEIMRWVRQP
jgi:ABC-2 type transport system permease protein